MFGTVSYPLKTRHCSLVKVYLYSTEIRSLSSVLCKLNAAARGSAGLREPWTSLSPPHLFSPCNSKNIIYLPASQIPPHGLSCSAVNTYEVTGNQINRLWTYSVKTKSDGWETMKRHYDHVTTVIYLEQSLLKRQTTMPCNTEPSVDHWVDTGAPEAAGTVECNKQMRRMGVER